jgi:hypothetical protein
MSSSGRSLPSTPSSGLCSERQVCIPSDVEELLIDVVADGFVLYCCGDRAAPSALVASYEWECCLDLVTIRDFDRVTAARVPKQYGVDLFAPQVAVRAYEGPPQRALRALLDLVHPTHPDAPASPFPAPPRLRIPRAQQRPMTMRLPSPGRAHARATRLAITMASRDSGSVKDAAGLPASALEGT